jgi:hypothetical protein
LEQDISFKLMGDGKQVEVIESYPEPLTPHTDAPIPNQDGEDTSLHFSLYSCVVA